MKRRPPQEQEAEGFHSLEIIKSRPKFPRMSNAALKSKNVIRNIIYYPPPSNCLSMMTRPFSVCAPLVSSSPIRLSWMASRSEVSEVGQELLCVRSTVNCYVNQVPNGRDTSSSRIDAVPPLLLAPQIESFAHQAPSETLLDAKTRFGSYSIKIYLEFARHHNIPSVRPSLCALCTWCAVCCLWLICSA